MSRTATFDRKGNMRRRPKPLCDHALNVKEWSGLEAVHPPLHQYPRLVLSSLSRRIGSNGFRGEGLSGLARSGFAEVERWIKTGKIILDPAGKLLQISKECR